MRTIIKVLYFLAGFSLVAAMNLLPIRASEYDRTSLLRIKPALEYKDPVLSRDAALCLAQGNGVSSDYFIPPAPVYTDQGIPFIVQETAYHVCNNRPVFYIGSLIANSILGGSVVLGVAWIISKGIKGVKHG